MLSLSLSQRGLYCYLPAVKSAVSYGETVEEALEMIKDAIEGIFEERGELERYAPVEIGSYNIFPRFVRSLLSIAISSEIFT